MTNRLACVAKIAIAIAPPTEVAAVERAGEATWPLPTVRVLWRLRWAILLLPVPRLVMALTIRRPSGFSFETLTVAPTTTGTLSQAGFTIGPLRTLTVVR